uniref:Uncharacterized protein n=1 Tax=Arundo donax TaxID=35708 RepID=A0A0A9H615_ARUDO
MVNTLWYYSTAANHSFIFNFLMQMVRTQDQHFIVYHVFFGSPCAAFT